MSLRDSCWPPPEGSSQHARRRRVSCSGSSSVGQLRLARPTKTTVVTTTTRTYITLPPLVINPPENLRERDPRQYPLASARPPEVIERFRFKYNGHDALFQTVDNEEGVRDALLEHHELNSELDVSNGQLKTETTHISEPDFATPAHARSAALPRSVHWIGPPDAPSAASYERSPPSLAVAAKMAGRQRSRRHHRKPRERPRSRDREGSFTIEDAVDPVLVTPDTDTGVLPDAPAGVPHSTTGPKPKGPAETPPVDKSFTRMEETLERPDSVWEQERGSSTSMLPPGDDDRLGVIRPLVETDTDDQSFLDGRVETPYIASPGLGGPSVRPRRLPPLDTVSAQDVCLPSPSLSPITAAAHVAHNHSAVFTGGPGRRGGGLTHVSSRDATRLARSAQGDQLIPTDLARLSDETAVSAEASSAPTLMSIPSMIDSFDALPDQMKTFVLYEMLRRCPRPTLHFVADTVNTALKCDFLDLLPLELSLNIIRYLDLKSLCNAAQVSKKWRTIIDTDEAAWKELFERDGYTLPPGELERAIKEGWGWQYPHSSESWERDLRPSSSAARSDADYATTTSSLASLSGSDRLALRSSSGRLKRKATTKQSSSRKRKKGDNSSRSKIASFRKPALHEGPNVLAEIAVAAVPSPNIGLESLRCMHLFKSIYQRHHLIRKSWMEEDSKPKHIAFRAHQRHVVTCLQFDTDKILTGSDDTNINVYDTKTGALRNRLDGHEGGVWALQYEGNTLVSGSTDRSVRVWDIEKGKCTAVFNGHTSTVRCLVILKPTQVGEAADGQPIMMPKEPLIITGSRDSTLRVWRLPSQSGSKTALQTGPPVYHDNDNPYFIRILSGHSHSVRAIAAHGDVLVSGSYDTTVRVWRISTGETIHQLHGHAQKVYSVVLDHARNRCISGSMDTSVKVWCLETGTCMFNLEGHASLVGLLDLSYDRLVSAAADSTLRIWDPDTGECKSTLRAHTGAITCFQHDAQKVISGSDRTLKMWNVKTGKFVKDLLTDLNAVWQVKFNERRCVAAVQRDNMTYIEVLDFGASRDGVPPDQLGRRIAVNSRGQEVEDSEDVVEADPV
ncbi:WD40 repeat-like protein [Westerdykella ornata]|uniref:WD40 repeat-like protein n=1 Tax=Westerdykella ornata TaxID=318751 RepID=A0A6A6JMI8_WESOR|nr:WD40 repeat-like protein [Westerdykella ornata]KAF2276876.1 WD40 repeat-like protein [Westerdykella ornata]